MIIRMFSALLVTRPPGCLSKGVSMHRNPGRQQRWRPKNSPQRSQAWPSDQDGQQVPQMMCLGAPQSLLRGLCSSWCHPPPESSSPPGGLTHMELPLVHSSSALWRLNESTSLSKGEVKRNLAETLKQKNTRELSCTVTAIPTNTSPERLFSRVRSPRWKRHLCRTEYIPSLRASKPSCQRDGPKTGVTATLSRKPLGLAPNPSLPFHLHLPLRLEAPPTWSTWPAWAPVATVTYDHNFTGFNKHRWIVLRFWRSEVQNETSLSPEQTRFSFKILLKCYILCYPLCSSSDPVNPWSVSMLC